MTTTVHCCDKCGEVIDTDRTLLEIASGSLRLQLGSTVELCRHCAPLLKDFLRAREAVDVCREAVPEPAAV